VIDVRSLAGAFPWQGQPPRLKIQNLTAVVLLAGLAGLSLLVYVRAFVVPYSLLGLYPYPRVGLSSFGPYDSAGPWRLVWAFLVQGGLYWLGWRLALQARGRAAWLVVLGGTLAFSAALLFLYPFDAADIFDNIMHGRIMGVYGANPFRDVASQFAGDPFYAYAAWQRTPSAYGPIWESLAGGVARLAGDGIIANVLAFKALGGLFLALSIGLVAVILDRVAPERTLAGVVLLAWNPVVLYETIGNGHNDLAMMVWVLAAVLAILCRRYTLAVLALLAGALVKFIPVLLIPVAGLIVWRDLAHARARLRFLAVTLPAALGLILASYGPVWYGFEGLGLAYRASLFTASLPSTLNAWLQLHFGIHSAGRAIGMVAAGLTGAFVLGQGRRAWRDGSWLSFAQAAFNILTFYLLVTCLWFQQWYTLWPLALAALLPPGHAPRLAALFSYAAMSKQLIVGPLLFWIRPRPPRAQLELVFGPAVLIIPWLYALLALWLVRREKPGKNGGTRHESVDGRGSMRATAPGG
jgi:hypothetical protein